MTNKTGMTHDAFSEQLMAFLEGETDDTTRAAMERHAQQCAECGALLADLRALRVEASKLPELTPTRDLWSGIAARIEAPVVPIGVSNGAAEAPAGTTGSRRWVRPSLAAAALVVAVGLGYVTGANRGSNVATNDTTDAAIVTGEDYAIVPDSMQSDSTDRTATPALAPATASARLAVNTLSADYDREIARLRVLLDERRNQLDPATVAIIEKNLKVIDGAIAESRKAIVRDPASRFLIESLNQSLESKVELLRVAAALPGRSS